jgi:adenine C2-methylase RlmN of 23S rRNA A2503 and tRNA A37
MENNNKNLEPKSHLYMNAIQYNRFISRAHESYIQTRIHGTNESHISDLAIESAAFFEALYHIMDAYSEETRKPLTYNYEFLDEVEDNFKEVVEKLNSYAKEEKNTRRKKTKRNKVKK